MKYSLYVILFLSVLGSVSRADDNTCTAPDDSTASALDVVAQQNLDTESFAPSTVSIGEGSYSTALTPFDPSGAGDSGSTDGSGNAGQ